MPDFEGMVKDRKVSIALSITGAIILLILACLVFNVNSGYMGSYKGTASNDLFCAEYIENGVLFNGQPLCYHGVVTSYYTYISYRIGGTANMQLAAAIINFLFSAALFFLIIKIIKIETGKSHWFLAGLMYVSMIFPLCMAFPESAFAALFMLLGIYVLFYNKFRFRELAAGFFFFMAFISKPVVIPVIGLVAAYYLFRKAVIIIGEKEDKETGNGKKIKIVFGQKKYYVSFRFRKLLKGVYILAPIIVGILLLQLKWRYFLTYYVVAPLGQVGTGSTELHSWFSIILHMLPKFGDNNMVYFEFYLAIIVMYYAFMKEKDLFSFVFVPSLIILNFAWIRSWTVGWERAFLFDRYTLPILSLFVISLTVFYAKFDKNKEAVKKAAILAAILLLIYFPLSRNIEATQLKKLVENSYTMPEQDNILTALGAMKTNGNNGLIPANNSLSDYWISAEMPILRSLEARGMLDKAWIPQNRNSTDEELAIYTYEISGKRFQNEFKEKKYSAIIFGPPGWDHVTRILNLNQSIASDYCAVYVPSAEYMSREGMHFQVLMFKNPADCRGVREQMRDYYQNNFEKICRISPFFAEDVVKSTMSMNNMYITKQCNSDYDLLNYYSERNISKKDLFFISLILIILLSYLLVILKNQKKKEMFNIIAVLLSLLIIIGAAFFVTSKAYEMVKPKVNTDQSNIESVSRHVQLAAKYGPDAIKNELVNQKVSPQLVSQIK